MKTAIYYGQRDVRIENKEDLSCKIRKKRLFEKLEFDRI